MNFGWEDERRFVKNKDSTPNAGIPENLGYDITSLDLNSGELRLIEVKGISAETGTILLTPNERRVAEDRRDCYWLYIITSCKEAPKLREPVKDPARLKWHEVKKVDHYYLSVDAMAKFMEIREKGEGFEYHKDYKFTRNDGKVKS